MRPVPFLAGISWFFTAFAMALAWFLHVGRSGLPAGIARGPVPPPLSRTSPVAPARRSARGIPKISLPPDARIVGDQGQPERAPVAPRVWPGAVGRPIGRPVPHDRGDMTQLLPDEAFEPLPSDSERSPRSRPTTTDEGSTTSLAACMVCGAAVESWVETDGHRLAYCRKHGTKPTATPPADKRATTSLRVQCRGVTKSGSRCRRTTTDPTEFCYQHKAQAGTGTDGKDQPLLNE